MSYKTSAIFNLFSGIIFLFATAFSLFSIMDFLSIPLPTALDETFFLSQLFCIEPILILFEDLVGLSISNAGLYFVYFFCFAFFVFSFMFSIALGFRRICHHRSIGITIFVEILTAFLIIYSLFTIIVYLLISAFIIEILIPTLIILLVSLLSFIGNLLFQKSN